MGILMPALQRVKKQAMAVACRSNLKQWGMCWSMYLQDNDFKFTVGFADKGRYYAWLDLMVPYYQNETIFSCPSANNKGPIPSDVSYPDGQGTGYWGNESYKWYVTNLYTKSEFEGSYGLNYWVSTQKNDVEWRLARYHWGDDLTKSRSQVPLFIGCVWTGGYPLHTDTPRVCEQLLRSGSGAMPRFLLDRHLRSTNAIFLDNSSRAVGLKELWTLKWHREFNTRGYWTTTGGVRSTDWPEWMRKFKDY